MTEIEGPRPATEDEFPEAMALVDRVFNNEPGAMQRANPHSFDPNRPDRHAILTCDGEIVSHVGCTPQTLAIGDEEVECWGITGVATDKRHRGNGYMTRLMEFWLDSMRDAEVPLTVLFGDRLRYRHYGYEIAGRQHSFSISKRSFPDVDVPRSAIRRYEGDADDVDLIRTLHEDERYRAVRDRETYRAFLGRDDLETLLYEGDGSTAYLAFNRGGAMKTIQECGGDPGGVRALLASVFESYDTSPISTFRGPGGGSGIDVSVHPHHSSSRLFDRVSDEVTVEPHQMLGIVDLAETLRRFAPQMERRWRRLNGNSDSVALGVAGTDEAVAIEYANDDVSIAPCGGDPSIELERTELVRLLFGFPGTGRSLIAERPFLSAVLPLDFYVPPLDQV